MIKFIYIECLVGAIFAIIYSIGRRRNFNLPEFIDFFFLGLALTACVAGIIHILIFLGFNILIEVVVEDYAAPMLGLFIGIGAYFINYGIDRLHEYGILDEKMNFNLFISNLFFLKESILKNTMLFSIISGGLISYSIMLAYYSNLFGGISNLLYMSLYHIVLLILIIVYKEVIFKKDALKDNHVIGLFSIALIFILSYINILYDVFNNNKTLLISITIIDFLIFVVLVPFTEEYMFRGILYEKIGFHNSTILFTIMHIPSIFLTIKPTHITPILLNFLVPANLIINYQTIFPFFYKINVLLSILFISYLFTLIRKYTNTIVYPTLAHSVINLIVISTFLL